MSVLTFPRLYFNGEIEWDTSTINSPYNNFYDRNNNELKLPIGITEDTFKRYIMGLEEGSIRSFHNLYGMNACNFVNVNISGGVLANGQFIEDDDEVINQPVLLLGDDRGKGENKPFHIVDLDPYSTWSSQIFYNRFQIGRGKTVIRGGNNSKSMSYWYDNHRNMNISKDSRWASLGSAVWQIAISKEKSDLFELRTKKSKLLKAFKKCLKADDALGLVVRFCAYRTLYYQNGIRNSIKPEPRNDSELSALYLSGAQFSNPAYSLVTGAIGIWRKGEFANIPTSRYLEPRSAVKPITELRGSIGEPDKKRKTPMWYLGPSLAEVNGEYLHLDLVSTVPEWDSSGLKANFGDIQVKVRSEHCGDTLIDTITYDTYNHRSYEKKSGIVDIPISEKHKNLLSEGQLLFTTTGSSKGLHKKSTEILAEKKYIAVSDNRGFYLDEGENTSASIRVIGRQETIPECTSVRIAQYENDYSKWSWKLLEHEEEYVEIAEGNLIKIGADGTANITFVPKKPGNCVILLFPVDREDCKSFPPKKFDSEQVWQVLKNFYVIAVRVLPFDKQLLGMDDSALTWKFVYENILKVYDHLHPYTSSKSHSVQLNSYDSFVQNATRMRKGLIEFPFESTLFMPVTRDLSAAKRKLLMRWLENGAPK